MGWAIVISFFVLVGWCVWVFTAHRTLRKEIKESVDKIKKNGLWLVLFTAAIGLSGCGIEQIEEGQRGVKKFGARLMSFR